MNFILSRCQSVLYRCSTNKKFRDITNIYKWMWKRECYLHSLLCMSSRLEMSFSRYKVQDTRRKIIIALKMNYIVRKIFMPLVHWNIILVADFCKSFFISLLLEIIGRYPNLVTWQHLRTDSGEVLPSVLYQILYYFVRFIRTRRFENSIMYWTYGFSLSQGFKWTRILTSLQACVRQEVSDSFLTPF